MVHDIQWVQMCRLVAVGAIGLDHAEQATVLHTIGELRLCIVWHLVFACDAVPIDFIVMVATRLDGGEWCQDGTLQKRCWTHATSGNSQRRAHRRTLKLEHPGYVCK